MYFLDAAKEMIINEGVESVSVRKIADVAGYSYATLYNYFQDLNELLWCLKQDMINDLVELLQKKMSDVSLDSDGIKRLFNIYISYYIENPNVFKFFYFHNLAKPNRKLEDIGIEPDFNVMMKETFRNFVLEEKLREIDIEVVGKTCIFTVHGMLTLFLSGNGELTEESLNNELDKIIDYLL